MCSLRYCSLYIRCLCMYFIRHYPVGQPVSSVSIVSGYGLDDRVIEVRSPAGAKDFSSNLCVQTGAGAHPSSCTMGNGFLSPGEKRGRGVTLTTHPHLVPRSIMSRSYTSSTPCVSMACSGTALILIFFTILLKFDDTPVGQWGSSRPYCFDGTL
jgi:hypothetical protein